MDIASSAAARAYQAARAGTEATPIEAPEKPVLQQGFSDFAQTLKTAETTAQAAMMGDADPHALVQALAQSELAVETAVTVRNKVVEAYQEILRMPV